MGKRNRSGGGRRGGRPRRSGGGAGRREGGGRRDVPTTKPDEGSGLGGSAGVAKDAGGRGEGGVPRDRATGPRPPTGWRGGGSRFRRGYRGGDNGGGCGSGCGMAVIGLLLVVIVGLLVYFFFIRDSGTDESFLLPLFTLGNFIRLNRGGTDVDAGPTGTRAAARSGIR